MTQLAVIEHQQRVQSFRLLASGFANAWPVIADGHRYGPIGPNTQLILMNTSSNVHLAFGDENVVATYDDVYFSPQGGFPGHVNSPSSCEWSRGRTYRPSDTRHSRKPAPLRGSSS